MKKSKGSSLFTLIEILGIIASLIWGNEFILMLFMAAMLLFCIVTCIVSQIKAPKAGEWKSIASCYIIFAILTMAGFWAVTTIAIPSVKAWEAQNEVTGPMRTFMTSDKATVYWDDDTLCFYTVYEDEEGKHFDKTQSYLSRESDMLLNYNQGYEFPPPFSFFTHVYAYPSTTTSISSDEYIITYDYENRSYIARVHIPGVIDFHESLHNVVIKLKTPASELDENIAIENSAEDAWNPGDWKVSQLASYVLIEGPDGSFDAKSIEMPYKDNEFFYSRLNQFYRAQGDDKTMITEDMIVPVCSFDITGSKVDKISFYQVGTKSGKTFNMDYMACEIVYSTGRTKVSVIREIPADLFTAAVDIS